MAVTLVLLTGAGSNVRSLALLWNVNKGPDFSGPLRWRFRFSGQIVRRHGAVRAVVHAPEAAAGAVVPAAVCSQGASAERALPPAVAGSKSAAVVPAVAESRSAAFASVPVVAANTSAVLPGAAGALPAVSPARGTAVQVSTAAGVPSAEQAVSAAAAAGWSPAAPAAVDGSSQAGPVPVQDGSVAPPGSGGSSRRDCCSPGQPLDGPRLHCDESHSPTLQDALPLPRPAHHGSAYRSFQVPAAPSACASAAPASAQCGAHALPPSPAALDAPGCRPVRRCSLRASRSRC